MIRAFRQSDKDIKVLNSIDIDLKSLIKDDHDYSKEIIHKPWGWEYEVFSNKDVAIWILHIYPHSATSMHCHPNKQTVLTVLKGEVLCTNIDTMYGLYPEDKVLIEKATFHQTGTILTSAVVMEIETPVNKNDLVRFKDLYGRA